MAAPGAWPRPALGRARRMAAPGRVDGAAARSHTVLRPQPSTWSFDMELRHGASTWSNTASRLMLNRFHQISCLLPVAWTQNVFFLLSDGLARCIGRVLKVEKVKYRRDSIKSKQEHVPFASPVYAEGWSRLATDLRRMLLL